MCGINRYCYMKYSKKNVNEQRGERLMLGKRRRGGERERGKTERKTRVGVLKNISLSFHFQLKRSNPNFISLPPRAVMVAGPDGSLEEALLLRGSRRRLLLYKSSAVPAPLPR